MTEMMNLKKHWFEEGGGFFGQHYIEGDNSMEGYLLTPMSLEERTVIEIEGVIRLLKLQTGERILDCPCGYGRHSIQLASRGFDVVGCDINAEMLEPALSSPQMMSNIRFVKKNMLHLTFDKEFDAVINLFFSFGFFETEEENNRVLRNFYRALKPGGKFIMHTDINVPRIASGKYKLQERRQLRSGGQLEISETCDLQNKRLIGTWTLFDQDGSKKELTPYTAIIYTMEDFTSMCEGAGFRNIRGYGDWNGAPLTSESEDMIVVAEKPLANMSA
jgi:ubiquinone/menaquinone biosynthesis C-methylase UbiE